MSETAETEVPLLTGEPPELETLDIEIDGQIRTLIVTGAGRAFCSGGDVNWFKRGVTDEGVDLPSEVRRGAEALHNAIVDIRRIPYPVIAAINGPAAGAGMSLALSADVRLDSEDAFLAVAYAR